LDYCETELVNCYVKLLGWLGTRILGILILNKEVKLGIDLHTVDRFKLAGNKYYYKATRDGFATRYNILPSIMRGLLEQ
jgi:hypothetical protein